MTTVDLTLADLRSGTDYPGGSINSRKTYEPKQVKERLESILAFGVLQSLIACPSPGETKGPYFVAAGGLRLASIDLGVKTKKLKSDFPIPVTIRPDLDSATALAASLEENAAVLPPHPVDTYEQFSELKRRGMTEAQIGKQFRIASLDVIKALKLGDLAPAVRDAWREGKISADVAQVFTLAKDQEHQETTLKNMTKARRLYPQAIRGALIGEQRTAQRFLNFVGQKNYEAAGGTIQTDLFAEKGSGDSLVIGDFALLTKLADKRLEEEVKKLTDAGWSWAEAEHDTTYYSRNRMDASAKSPPAIKERSGALVSISHDGSVEIHYGILKSGQRAPAVKTDKTGTAVIAQKKDLSNSLREDLKSMSARAVKDALIAEAASHQNKLAAIALLVLAEQITPERLNYMPREVRGKLDALRDALDPRFINAAMKKRFDAQRYFSSAPMPLVLKAIDEAMGGDHKKALAGGTKSKAWKFALANVPKTDWLPPELRGRGYAAVGAKAKTAKKSKK